jgi:hypothetical protein
MTSDFICFREVCYYSKRHRAYHELPKVTRFRAFSGFPDARFTGFLSVEDSEEGSRK